MRRLRLALLGAGVAVLAALVGHVGPAAIALSLSRVTWAQMAAICAVHGLAMAADTLGWRYAFERDRVAFPRLLAARAAGEAVNLVTALASVGGEAIKAWLVRRHAPYEESVPSVIVAKTAATVSQAAFLLIGVALAWTMFAWDSPFVSGLVWLLLIEVLAVGGFLAVQLSGAIRRAGRLFAAVGLPGADTSIARLDEDLRRYYREPRRFAASVACHGLGGAFAVAETWLIARAIGVDASLAMAALIDAVGAGIRFATFLVPASVGALESGTAAAFAALGVGASTGLVFSLVRRARQVVWIALGLLVLMALGARSRRGEPQRRRA